MRKGFSLIVLLIFSTLFTGQMIPFGFRKHIVSGPGTPNITWGNKPSQFQLFQRDSDDSSTVQIGGILSTSGYDSIYTSVYRNGVFKKRYIHKLNYVLSDAIFDINTRICSELAEYCCSTYVKSTTDTILVHTADSLVSGDVYIIAGQSNGQNPDLNVTFTDQYCRTFGVQTDSLNTSTYNAADTLWRRSTCNYDDFSILPRGNYPHNVGVLGMQLQRYIRDSTSTPTAVINGTRWGTSITTHLRNNSNPTHSRTYYGKLLYRLQMAKLQDRVKNIIWFQGEIDVDAANSTPQNPNVSPFNDNPRGLAGYSNYASKFDSLYNSWNTDYTALQKVFVVQVRPLSCAGSTFAQELRETQRTLQNTYSKVQLVSSNGIGSYNNCHYFYQGYQQLALVLFKNMGQLYYGATDTANCRPPSIRRAFYTSSAKTKIGMVFNNSAPGSIPADSLGKNIKNYFYLNKTRTANNTVSSITLSNDTLFLNLSAASTSSRLSYIPNNTDSAGTIYNGPWIRNARGLGVLSFNNVLIFEPESEALFTRTVTTTITPAREVLMDSLVKRLKTNNVWTGDALYIYANLDTGLANLNWLSGTVDSFRCIQNGTINFTADRGYLSDGVSGYLNTQYRPVYGSTFLKLSGAVAVYSHDDFPGGGLSLNRPFGVRTIGTNSYVGMLLNTTFGGGGEGFYTNVNDVNAIKFTNGDASGLFVSNRQDTLTVRAYRNYNGTTGVLGSNTNQPAQAKASDYLYVCAYNEGGPFGYIPSRICMFRIGGSWSTTQITNFTTDIEWYMDTVGAGVIP